MHHGSTKRGYQRGHEKKIVNLVLKWQQQIKKITNLLFQLYKESLPKYKGGNQISFKWMDKEVR